MITKEQAQKLGYRDEIHYTGKHNCHLLIGKHGGKKVFLMRVRVSGKFTEKKRAGTWRVPVKYGLYESGEIANHNCHLFHLPKDCPLDKETANAMP